MEKEAVSSLMSFLRSKSKQPYEALQKFKILICLLTCRLQLKIQLLPKQKQKSSKTPPKMQSYGMSGVSGFMSVCDLGFFDKTF